MHSMKFNTQSAVVKSIISFFAKKKGFFIIFHNLKQKTDSFNF